MKHLDHAQFEKMAAGAIDLSPDDQGGTTLRMTDGRFLKIFRRKRRISSARIQPPAIRFARASRELLKRGVRTVRVEDVRRVPSIRRDVVVYQPIEGEPFRESLRAAADPSSILTRFAEFLAVLHGNGIYFRGVHFGNILIGPDNVIGLIDIADTTFSRGALSHGRRARNFRPLVRYPEDRAAMTEFGVDRFVRQYLGCAALPSRSVRRFLRRLSRIDPLYEHIEAQHDRAENREAPVATTR